MQKILKLLCEWINENSHITAKIDGPHYRLNWQISSSNPPPEENNNEKFFNFCESVNINASLKDWDKKSFIPK